MVKLDGQNLTVKIWGGRDIQGLKFVYDRAMVGRVGHVLRKLSGAAGQASYPMSASSWCVAVPEAAAHDWVAMPPIHLLRAACLILSTAPGERCPGPVASLRCIGGGDVAAVFASGGPPQTLPWAKLSGLILAQETGQPDLSLPRNFASSSELAPAALSLALLGRALEWLQADCFREFELMRELASDDVCMFGTVGIDEFVAFKERIFTEAVNYSIDAVHEVDLANRVVVANFDCLIPGKEGRGTDVIQFNEGLKV